MYNSLPSKEAIVNFKHTGAVTGYNYDGEFKVKCILTIADRHRLEIEKTQMMADFQNPSTTLSILSTVLAALRVRIIKAPDWWKESKEGADIIDEECLYDLYELVMDQEKDWKQKLNPPQPDKENNEGN